MVRPLPPLETERLHLRPFARDGEQHERDLADVLARRNDPEVARWQTWTLPFTREQAQQLLSPASDEGLDGWRMLVAVDRASGATVGDVALGLSWDARMAEIGYTLAPEHRGRGFATEAAQALVDHCFDTVGVTRVAGTLHPDNVPSARVLERLGFEFEGRTRLSYWVGEDNSDDWIYGLTRADRETWRSRPTSRPDDVRLVEVTHENVDAVRAVRVHHTQVEHVVASVEQSLGDALVSDEVDGHLVTPWYRAVEADGELVGFVMVAAPDEHLEVPMLWRLLVDRRHQGRGVGGRILDLVVDQCRAWGAPALDTSFRDDWLSPRRFYESHGFVATGDVVDEVEPVARLTL